MARYRDIEGKKMAELAIREMGVEDREGVAELICVSTNYWYEQHGLPRIFADVFYKVYGGMAGSVGIMGDIGGRLAGSCFYHVRETHVSLGIMNAHPNYFGQGVARGLLAHIVNLADGLGKPVRLVSSALNLDSYSLYTRAGFVPRCVYQDIVLQVPGDGIEDGGEVATRADVGGMAAIEKEISGISRLGDYRHFIENKDGFWHVSVCEDDGEVSGFLASSGGMLGPGVARSEEQAAALLLAELNRLRGEKVIFLVPAEYAGLVQRAYGWGGRNCELHRAQVRGNFQPFAGVSLPTFMPETG